MKKYLSYALSALIALSLTACSQSTPTTTAEQKLPQSTNSSSIDQKPTVTDFASKPDIKCRPDPLAGVYHPTRLEVKEACKTVTGTVEAIKHESDGDYHINLKLDDQYANLINDKNTKDEHGNLVVEIIPLDEPNVPTPKKGQHITVTGSYVLDKHHGWMEIHPAWNIDGKGTATYDKAAAEKSAASPSDEDEQSEASVQPVQSTASNISPAKTEEPKEQKASVQIISVTSPAPRNSIATLKAKIAPGATASISVHYKSGPSKAAGLESKKADSNGYVSWSWHVGGNTTIGTWPITVTSDGVSEETHFEVVH